MTFESPSIADLDGIAFDFDGVIIESAEIKTRAFETLFQHLPEHLDAIRRHHLANAGLSRFDKFEWIYRELLGRPLADSESRRLGEQFTALVLEKTLTCPFVPGARALLNRLQRARVPVFVASGTPHSELAQIIQSRNLEHLLAGFWGSPTPKEMILRTVLERLDAEPTELLMVGDAPSDLRAAEAVGVHFIARATAEQRTLWLDRGFEPVDDLNELSVVLRLE